MKFEEIASINVNEHTEKKNGLTYLSWAWAIAEIKKIHPDLIYEVKKFDDGRPYVYDPNTGYMVFTSVTVDGLTHEMWLPVMDSANNAMKDHAYTKKTKYKEFTVEAATMFDINKTIMRCLVKNIAMATGLGLYIYAGEDLPESEKPTEEDREALTSKIMNAVGVYNLDAAKVFNKAKINGLDELPVERLNGMLNWLNGLDEAKRKELM